MVVDPQEMAAQAAEMQSESGETQVESGEGQIQEQEGVETGEQQIGEAAESTEAAPTWETAALPEDHPAFGRFKNQGDYHKAVSSSYQEAQRLGGEVNRQQGLLDGYKALLMQERQSAQQAPQQQPGGFLGFGSRDEYQKSMEFDPQGTIDRMLHDRLSNSDFISDMVNERVQAEIAPVKNNQLMALRNAQIDQLAARYPDAVQGNPSNEAAAVWIEQNQGIFNALRDDEQVNIAELAYKAGNFDIMAQKLVALEQQMETRRGTSGTAKPGSGAVTKVKLDGTAAGNVRAAVEDMRAAGIEVPQHEQDQATAAFEEYFPVKPQG